MNSINPKVEQNDWQTCEPGTLGRLAKQYRAGRQRRSFIRAGSAMAVLLICGAATLMVSKSIEQAAQVDFGGISCDVVMANGDAFRNGQIDPELRVQMIEHVRLCPHCKSMQAIIAEPTVSGLNRWLAVSSKPAFFQFTLLSR